MSFEENIKAFFIPGMVYEQLLSEYEHYALRTCTGFRMAPSGCRGRGCPGKHPTFGKCTGLKPTFQDGDDICAFRSNGSDRFRLISKQSNERW